MIEDLEKNDYQEEEKKLTCPECEKGFRDMRGLTSHARHKHDLSKEEITESIYQEKSSAWKIIGGIGAFLLAVLSAGKLK